MDDNKNELARALKDLDSAEKQAVHLEKLLDSLDDKMDAILKSMDQDISQSSCDDDKLGI